MRQNCNDVRRRKNDRNQNKLSKPIYTFDTETDPFLYEREPVPFLCGIYDGEKMRREWGKGCMDRMRKRIADLPPGIVYVHNGGRFDFFYMLDWFDGKLSITGSRIIKALGLGHEWRDSAAVYPMPLKSFKKKEIDYSKMEKSEREKHKQEIIEYFDYDCIYLHELVSRIRAEFGDTLTIGSIAMKELKKFHKFDTLTSVEDARLRDRFYFGGRVQCFEKGIITPNESENLYVFDINQSYPSSMRNFHHPIGHPIFRNGYPSEDTFFVTAYGRSTGVFPKRDSDGNLSFPIGVDTYNVSIHEYNAAIDTQGFDTFEILECVDFEKSGTFIDFVNHWHGMRKREQLNGDKVWSDFYKRLCNSAYGKFPQNPENYFDWLIKPIGVTPDGYDLDYLIGNIALWKKPSEDSTLYNVATGASITGCSRAYLIRALATAKRPLYCDTDSIICEGMGNEIEIDATKLGCWKLENYGDRLAIAGRKLYALFRQGECVKMASKGVRITAQQIEQVARGGKVTWKKDAPTFSLSGQVKFLARDVVMT